LPGGETASSIEPLYRIPDVIRIVNCSSRTFERERAAGRFPKPDRYIGKSPRWKGETIRAWIEKGGAK
jgi:predicted DNA-binding transcriptional regulator AlpA